MFKNALVFAGASLMLAFAAPTVVPMLENAGVGPQPSFAPAANAVPQPAAPEPLFATPQAQNQGFRQLTIPADARGQYFIEAMIDGERVPFLVDTGASFVTITTEVAHRLGLYENAGSPHYRFQTANGATESYGVTLKSVDLGSIYVADVDAAVNPNLGGINLLGANFLKRLNGVEQRNGALTLRQ